MKKLAVIASLVGVPVILFLTKGKVNDVYAFFHWKRINDRQAAH